MEVPFSVYLLVQRLKHQQFGKLIIVLFFFLFLGIQSISAQLKVGQNPDQIHPSSILELESSDKVFVLTRLTNSEMMNIAPLNGALVYNTDERCVFLYENNNWKNLCNSELTITTSENAPSIKSNGDLWINDVENILSVWNGNVWSPITLNYKRGAGPPSTSTVDTAVAGDLYVDKQNGGIYAYDGTSWVSHGSQQEQVVIVANNGQTQFTTPVPIIDSRKIDVFRNGIRIDFTAVDANTIELNNGISCYQNDKIRIVQIF